MDISLLIRNRLEELGLDQKDLAAAAEVTESYISQLLARKKAPPAPGRTDIYEKIGAILKLPSGELSNLAEVQRREELRKKLAEQPQPLFENCRELILRKCEPARQKEVRRIFENEAFGELERLVTQKLFEAAQAVARDESDSENWLHEMAELGGRDYTDVFRVSVESCMTFLEPTIASWDIDLKTFGITVVLNRHLGGRCVKRFEYVEQATAPPVSLEPGLDQFLKDKTLSGDATHEEIEFLKALKFKGKRPTSIYYYRELQNLRDPLHFLPIVQS